MRPQFSQSTVTTTEGCSYGGNAAPLLLCWKEVFEDHCILTILAVLVGEGGP